MFKGGLDGVREHTWLANEYKINLALENWSPWFEELWIYQRTIITVQKHTPGQVIPMKSCKNKQVLSKAGMFPNAIAKSESLKRDKNKTIDHLYRLLGRYWLRICSAWSTG